MTISQPYLALLIVLLLPAMFFDIRQHRIPNWLTLSFWIIGIASHVVLQGWNGFLESGGGWLLMLALMLPLYALGFMGAADVKLMAAVGAIVGSGATLQVAFGIVLTGMLMSLVMLAKQGLLVSVLSRFRDMFGLSVATRRAAYLEPVGKEKHLVLPYAIPITIGTLCALVLMSI